MSKSAKPSQPARSPRPAAKAVPPSDRPAAPASPAGDEPVERGGHRLVDGLGWVPREE